MRKKILYLRTDPYIGPLLAGGSVTHVQGVVQGFLNLGYEVVYASSVEMPTVDALPVHKKIVLSISKWVWRTRRKPACFLSNFFFYRQIISHVRHETFDFIYQRYSLLGFLGVWLSSVLKVPLVLEFNGSELWIDQHWVTKKRLFKLQWLMRYIEMYNLRNASRIVVVSQVLKDSLVAQGIGAEKITVIPNGVDTTYFDPACLSGPRERIRKELGIENRFVFGFIGTFGPWHGIETIAHMIPAVVQRHANAHFMMIGDGVAKEQFCKTIESLGLQGNVTMIGTVPSSKARDYLAACDAFLCPTQPNSDGSRFFGSPTKLFEYMSLAKPIIASDLEQLTEIIRPAVRTPNLQPHDEVGILVAPQDTQGFIAAASKLIEWPDEIRATIGHQARKKAEQVYSWDQHVRKIIESTGQL